MVFPQITKTSSTKSRVIAKKRTIVLSLQKMKILQWKYLYFLYIIVKGIFVNIRMRSSVATKLCKKCTRISSEMRWLYYPILHFNVQYRTLFFCSITLEAKIGSRKCSNNRFGDSKLAAIGSINRKCFAN